MTGLPGYDAWKLMSPEDERDRYGDRDGYGPELDKAESELDLVYDDLHKAQALILEMRTVLKCADSVLTHLGATDEYAIIQIIRRTVEKAEEASK